MADAVTRPQRPERPIPPFKLIDGAVLAAHVWLTATGLGSSSHPVKLAAVRVFRAASGLRASITHYPPSGKWAEASHDEVDVVGWPDEPVGRAGDLVGYILNLAQARRLVEEHGGHHARSVVLERDAFEILAKLARRAPLAASEGEDSREREVLAMVEHALEALAP